MKHKLFSIANSLQPTAATASAATKAMNATTQVIISCVVRFDITSSLFRSFFFYFFHFQILSTKKIKRYSTPKRKRNKEFLHKDDIDLESIQKKFNVTEWNVRVMLCAMRPNTYERLVMICVNIFNSVLARSFYIGYNRHIELLMSYN